MLVFGPLLCFIKLYYCRSISQSYHAEFDVSTVESDADAKKSLALLGLLRLHFSYGMLYYMDSKTHQSCGMGVSLQRIEISKLS